MRESRMRPKSCFTLHKNVVIAAIFLCVVTRQISGQLNAGKSSSAPNRIVDAEIAPSGGLQIHLADGRQIRPSPEKGQIACEQVRICSDIHYYSKNVTLDSKHVFARVIAFIPSSEMDEARRL